ncbi:MAG: class I adenylate cyclase [Sedimenticola sp.]
MSGAINYEDGIGRKELNIIRDRFLEVHGKRLQRIENELRPAQRTFIELLPLLFHINHPMLPGFVSSETPAGIPNYSPGRNALLTAKSISRSFTFEKRARRRFDIQGLYLMGSIGSIAHTAGSDFDVWLCYDPRLEKREILALREKVEKLETWATELALEVHIFLVNVETFRSGKRDALSHESSGTAQPNLLLEEFYRTAVLLAGRYPLWWLIPPDEESNYSSYAKMLVNKRFVDPLDILDFGGLEKLPPKEFFGAAHWQLYKGIQSPYKSILKLLLTESYAQDYPDIRWLCQDAKKAVYAGTIDTSELDPYMMMYQRVEQFLQLRNEPKRLDLARRCFYFKAEQALSKPYRLKHKRWQREVMQVLATEWGWDQAKLITLDSRADWKIDKVLEERNILVRELTNSYRLLTDFARTFTKGRGIDPRELSLLGRKLYTTMEKRPGKVDQINPGISVNLVESQISLHYFRTKAGEQGWHLHLGDIGELQAEVTRPVKTTAGLIEMLTWCHLNTVVDRGTKINIYPVQCAVQPEELHALLNTIRHHYKADSHHTDIPIEQLEAQPYAQGCLLFINIGTDPMARLSREGKQLTSNRSDPLSFGAAHASLVESVDMLIQTSWGEHLATGYTGLDGLFVSLCNYMRLTLTARDGHTPPDVEAHSFSSVRAEGIAKRVKKLFDDACHCFGPKGPGIDSRYLAQAGDSYYIIQSKHDGYSHIQLSSWHELLETLSLPNDRFRPVCIDSMALNSTPLPAIYKKNRAGVVQVFYITGKQLSDIFVLDENGSLFHQRLQGTDEHYLVAHQQRFFSGLQVLQNLLSNQSEESALLRQPEFYRLIKNPQGQFTTQKRRLSSSGLPESYLELRAVSSGLDLNLTPFILTLGEEEFSSLDLGQRIFETVARHVLSKRQNRQTYPIYLTSLELSGSAVERSWTTIDLLKYKKRLEGRLNQALQQIFS